MASVAEIVGIIAGIIFLVYERTVTTAMPRRYRILIFPTAACQLLLASLVSAQAPIISDDFEADLHHWVVFESEFVESISEPGTANRVLMLTPKPNGFSHVILKGSEEYKNVRMEGRFLFPTEGDGYLGFIYNYRQSDDRNDFGCIYVKSNGSYVRMSPHYDGNPSWRLYEELKVSLEGNRRIQTDVWYQFRLDAVGARATLYIDDMSTPVAEFDLFPETEGALGLEARPGMGEPVWVDDILIYKLPPGLDATQEQEPAASAFTAWAAYGGAVDTADATSAKPDFRDEGWYGISPDRRGAIITGRLTQFTSGDDDIVFLRATFSVNDTPNPGWLAISSANQLDVWVNDVYVGTVGPQPFIWADHATSKVHPGARLPIAPIAGENEVILRVHGDRFAGGGFFARFLAAE